MFLKKFCVKRSDSVVFKLQRKKYDSKEIVLHKNNVYYIYYFHGNPYIKEYLIKYIKYIVNYISE